MSSRLEKVYSLIPNEYNPGMPVLICGGNLLRDTYSGRMFVQLKFQNLSPKLLLELRVVITTSNRENQNVESKDYIFSQLFAARDAVFAEQEVIPLDNLSCTSFSVVINEAVYRDGSRVTSHANRTSILEPQQPLKNHLERDDELVKQYRIIFGERHIFVPDEIDDIWRCSCGAINNRLEQYCHICGGDASAILHPDIIELKRACNTRLAEEKRRKTARKRRKNRIIGITTAAISAVILTVALLHFLIIPQYRYKSAMQKMERGDYRAAYEDLVMNGSFKDSIDRANDAKRLCWTTEYENILTQGYDDYTGEGYSLSQNDVSNSDCLFSLAYIDGDDIPELLVSPYGDVCWIFSIEEDLEGECIIGPRLMNTRLSINQDDDSEIGYYEGNGYVYDYFSYYEGTYEFWGTLDENTDFDNVLFAKQVTYYDYYEDDYEYSFIYPGGDEEYVDEDRFYEILGAYVSEEKYRPFDLHSNSEKNRSLQFNNLQQDT